MQIITCFLIENNWCTNNGFTEIFSVCDFLHILFFRDLGAAMHLLKSSLGTGILAMPYAILNGGLLFGGIGTIIIGLICAHCVHILVRTSHVLCRRTKTPQLTYAETAYTAFLYGPKNIRSWAKISKIFVNTALCTTYVGGTCVYVVFVATSIKQVGALHNSRSQHITLPRRSNTITNLIYCNLDLSI